jgi:hypothetical protein
MKKYGMLEITTYRWRVAASKYGHPLLNTFQREVVSKTSGAPDHHNRTPAHVDLHETIKQDKTNDPIRKVEHRSVQNKAK